MRIHFIPLLFLQNRGSWMRLLRLTTCQPIRHMIAVWPSSQSRSNFDALVAPLNHSFRYNTAVAACCKEDCCQPVSRVRSQGERPLRCSIDMTCRRCGECFRRWLSPAPLQWVLPPAWNASASSSSPVFCFRKSFWLPKQTPSFINIRMPSSFNCFPVRVHGQAVYC